MLLEILIERRAVDKGHDQVPVFGIAEPIEDAWQQGMAERGEDLGLAVEGIGGFDDLLRGQSLEVDLLHRDQLVAFLRVARFIDRAKAARADLAEHLVALVEQGVGVQQVSQVLERLLTGAARSLAGSVLGSAMVAEIGDGHGRFPSLRGGGLLANHGVQCCCGTMVCNAAAAGSASIIDGLLRLGKSALLVFYGKMAAKKRSTAKVR